MHHRNPPRRVLGLFSLSAQKNAPASNRRGAFAISSDFCYVDLREDDLDEDREDELRRDPPRDVPREVLRELLRELPLADRRDELPPAERRDEPLRGDGTLAPFLRASESPIAIAWARLFTVPPCPDFPLFSVPFFRRCMALSTDLEAASPYLRPPLDLVLDLRVGIFLLLCELCALRRTPAAHSRPWFSAEAMPGHGA